MYLGEEVFVDLIDDFEKNEIKVYNKVIYNYLVYKQSDARIRIEEKKVLFKTKYYVLLQRLVHYTISAFPPIMSELLSEYYKNEDKK